MQAGEHFKDGDMVSGIYEDCDVRLTEFEETGRMVLRVIIPDKHNRFPEDAGCDVRYTLQILRPISFTEKEVGKYESKTVSNCA